MFFFDKVRRNSPYPEIWCIVCLLVFCQLCYSLIGVTRIPVIDNYFEIEAFTPDSVGCDVTFEVGDDDVFDTEHQTFRYQYRTRTGLLYYFTKPHNKSIKNSRGYDKKDKENFLNMIANGHFSESINLYRKGTIPPNESLLYYHLLTQIQPTNSHKHGKYVTQTDVALHGDTSISINGCELDSIIHLNSTITPNDDINKNNLYGHAVGLCLWDHPKREEMKPGTWMGMGNISKMSDVGYKDSVSLSHLLWRRYDISKKYYKFYLYSNTIYDCNIKLIPKGLTKISLLPSKATRDDDGTYYVEDYYIFNSNDDIKSHCFSFYTEDPELENLQYIRLFFITACLSLLLGAFVKYFFDTIKKYRIKIWKKRKKVSTESEGQ